MPTLRDNRKEETRRLLEAAALKLFGQNGFRRTSIDAIAAEAGVSRTTFFRYFPSKEAVVFSAQDAAGEGFSTLLAARPPGESPFRAFEEALVALARKTEDDPVEKKRALDLWALIGANPELRARLTQRTAEATDDIARILARRDSSDEPKIRHVVASSIAVALAQQVNLVWQESKGDLSIEDLLRERFRVLRDLCAD